MRKYVKFVLSIILCIFITNCFLITSYAKSEDVYLSLDFQNSSKLPDNFRTTANLTNLQNKNINISGLSKLNISGSAQFTALSLTTLKNTLKNNTKSQIIDIDLRQESHGFINGNAVSWYGPGDKANAGLSLDEVIKKENEQLSSIPFGKPVSLDNGKYTLVPTVVESEEQLVKPNNIKYFRLTITDGDRPTDEMVDRFINFIVTMPENSWLHFHCKEGLGRTTTFMALYDMMKNSKSISLSDIVARQFALGGLDLLKPYDEDKRVIFIQNFYNYTKNNTDNFKTTWSDWVKQNNITPYTLQDEIRDNKTNVQ